MPGAPLTAEVIADLDHDLHTTGTATVAVFAPFTGEKIHDLPTSTAGDVADAAASARLAQLAWHAAGFAHRRSVLLKAHDLLLKSADSLLDAVQMETGKTRGNAFEEVLVGALTTRYYALSAKRVLKTRGRRPGIPTVVSTQVSYKPKGLIGVITPWNYPLALAIFDVIPALAAGNAVVQKADNQGALTMLTARRLFLQAGVPPELWAVVAGDGKTIGDAVVDAADYVCFTGSTPTGTGVGVRAATALHGASLELGGKNPMIVLDDVDPAKAARDAVYAVYSSMGQLCVSIERIYVARPILEKFTTEFVARTAALSQGPAYDYTTDVGSLTLPSQLERVKEHVADAIAKGATVLTGGTHRPDLGPLFFEPTVLTGVTDAMECSRHETFGPVVAITPYDTVEEAILAANDSEFGLNASIFTRSVRRGRRIALLIDAGSVNINEGYRATFSSVDAPMGGMKHSGIGRRNGPEGILRFAESRTTANATGFIRLPGTGAEWKRLVPVMFLLARTLKALRLR